MRDVVEDCQFHRESECDNCSAWNATFGECELIVCKYAKKESINLYRKEEEDACMALGVKVQRYE